MDGILCVYSKIFTLLAIAIIGSSRLLVECQPASGNANNNGNVLMPTVEKAAHVPLPDDDSWDDEWFNEDADGIWRGSDEEEWTDSEEKMYSGGPKGHVPVLTNEQFHGLLKQNSLGSPAARFLSSRQISTIRKRMEHHTNTKNEKEKEKKNDATKAKAAKQQKVNAKPGQQQQQQQMPISNTKPNDEGSQHVVVVASNNNVGINGAEKAAGMPTVVAINKAAAGKELPTELGDNKSSFLAQQQAKPRMAPASIIGSRPNPLSADGIGAAVSPPRRSPRPMSPAREEQIAKQAKREQLREEWQRVLCVLDAYLATKKPQHMARPVFKKKNGKEYGLLVLSSIAKQALRVLANGGGITIDDDELPELPVLMNKDKLPAEILKLLEEEQKKPAPAKITIVTAQKRGGRQ